ncbi:MAG: HlyD family efflux transporter periplasmic adaptor subunit [Leptolyngbya sp. DLM2.Bin15]|nr:MAG: HlyD family efflux transporter periplasmic adaptor subunit [Leptolyngbya sp. DLM2.Bin15]
MTQVAPSNHSSSPTSSPAGQSAQTDPPKRSLSLLRLIVPLLLVVGVAAWGARTWLFQPQETGLTLSGRIEGYDINLGAKTGGRVESVAVREGDRVQAGQVIARLDDGELQAAYQAAQAGTLAARQQAIQAESQIAVVQSQLAEAALTLQQSEGDTVGRVSQAEATVATAVAQLAQAQAQVQRSVSELQLAEVERDRLQSLLADGAVPQQELDVAQTRFESAQSNLAASQATLAAAEQQVSAAQGGLVQAQTTQFNPDIRSAQLARLQRQLEQAQSQWRAAQAEVERAIALEQEVAARLANLAIVSPIDGVVVNRMVEPGEVIGAGATVATVINLNDVYLRGYIPQGEVGNVRVGQAAQVFLDSDPNQPLAARVIAIDTEASFTPENIYFRDDRVTQVFGLRLGIDNPDGFAKPGMPADGEILLSEEE